MVGILVIVGGGLLFLSTRSSGGLSNTSTSTATTTTGSEISAGLPGDTSTPAEPGTPAPGSSTHPYGRVTLKIGETAVFKDLTITPTAVTQDSRCPESVQCIQAGTVEVSLKIVSGLGTSNSSVSLGETVTTESENIKFVSASPAKLIPGTISTGDYRLTFDVTKKPVALGKCYVGGCSGQICSDQEGAISTCEYRAEYACYKTATCERQQNGQCGWTSTPALTMCLNNPPAL